jgi:hypothetical protein
MKSFRHQILALCFLVLASSVSPVFARKFSPYYLHQFALTAGLGDASSPDSEFPYCYSLGGYIRSDFSLFGARRDYFGQLNIEPNGKYYRFQSLFYGFAFVSEHAALIPQVGFGLMKTNAFEPLRYNKPGLEISFEGFFHTRGSGLGARFFYQRSSDVQYVGFMVQATLGWMWNNKKRDKPIKSEGKGSF